MENDNNNVEALTTILSALKGMDTESQKRILQAVITFLGISWSTHDSHSSVKSNDDVGKTRNNVAFSEDRAISVKNFLRDKSPKTDIERIACLAYYLTHYRDLPHFKTIDLSTLNTEAAQPKLSNPTVALNNATMAGLLVQAGKGNKQISAAGELFVQALPDRDAAKLNLSSMRWKKRNKKSSTKNSNE